MVVVIDFGPGRVERRAVELLAPRGKWRVGGDGWFGGRSEKIGAASPRVKWMVGDDGWFVG